MTRKILAAVALLLLAACSSSSKRTLGGSFVLRDEPIANAATTCVGHGGYDDIQPGVQVVVRDQKGTILATGHLGTGKPTDLLGVYRSCTFPVEVSGIPDRAFYTVEVSHRGQQTYSKADLVKAGWKVHLTLGS